MTTPSGSESEGHSIEFPLEEIFETSRLIVRRAVATASDIDLYYRLWNDLRVMRFVGFPQGLKLDREAVAARLADRSDDVLEALLIVIRKADGGAIGECKLGRPDKAGVCETDIKLLPDCWGQGFGRELKQGLVDYLFTRTSCQVVRATPNRENVASQRMQERVGARRTGEGVFRFDRTMEVPTRDVPYYVYELSREEWRSRRGDLAKSGS